ncbi:contractile injection system protein, VgrG/Pvc8 family [Legionella londiniensis]|uniref:Phage-related baseplate assembly protein n=1 Tax=Legionella londiniensis TaxID=45068 RepID=A0A0W0VTF3_9GAMM|nr:contractile injection system protein, VgrG/Pvc8 family [Legionella londiniensis]KTD23336.1 hypothetical protein Llon_0221 [Legionella londiniensis]STX94109.1 Uncharacterized protein conserved in bacteria [Legionella londiniensis]
MELASHAAAAVTGNQGCIIYANHISWENFGLNSRYRITVCGLTPKKLCREDYGKARIQFGKISHLIYDGELLSLTQKHLGQDGFEFKLVFGSSLHRLENSVQHRLYIDCSLEEIIRDILSSHEIKAVFHLEKVSCRIPYAAQGDVSDYDFLLRLCIEHGIVFFYHNNQRQETELYFTYDWYPYHEHRVLFNPANGMAGGQPVISALHYFCENLAENISLRGASEDKPTRILEAFTVNKTDIPGQGVITLDHVYVLTDEADCQRRALCLQEQLDWQREWLRLETNLFPAEAGDCIAIENHPNPRANGVFRILQITGSADGSLKSSATHPARQTIWLISIDYPYRMPHPATKLIWNEAYGPAPESWQHSVTYPTPGLETALIAGQEGQLALDGKGRYPMLPLFCPQQKARNKAYAVRMVHPATGQACDKAWGMHMPLLAGTRVILAHLHNLIDKPIILGTIAGELQKDPVNSCNPTQLVIRHHSGSALIFEDSEQKQNIYLHTKSKNHGLFFSKNQDDESILLDSLGTMHVQSAKDFNIHSGQDFVMANQSTEFSANQELSMAMQKDMSWQAKESIRQNAGHDWQLQCAKGNLDLQGNKIEAKASSLYFQGRALTAEANTLAVQATRDLTLSSDKDLKMQVGACELKLAATNVFFNAPELSIYAQVIIKMPS